MTNDKTPPAPESEKAKKSRLEIAREKAAQANALLQKLEAQARAKQAGQERKLDTRRKVLLGAYLATKMQKDDDLKMQTLAELDKYLTRPAERSLFDLPPLTTPTTMSEEDRARKVRQTLRDVGEEALKRHQQQREEYQHVEAQSTGSAASQEQPLAIPTSTGKNAPVAQSGV